MPNQYRDPITELIRTKATADRRTWKAFSSAARVSTSTVANLVSGRTREPKHRTVIGVLQACGIHEQLVNGDGRPIKLQYDDYLTKTRPKSQRKEPS